MERTHAGAVHELWPVGMSHTGEVHEGLYPEFGLISFILPQRRGEERRGAERSEEKRREEKRREEKRREEKRREEKRREEKRGKRNRKARQGFFVLHQGRHVHEGFSYNQFIGTDVAQVAVEMNQDLHMERADRIAVTTSVLCVVVEMGGSGGSSR
ncbi:hypothetical protein GRJ2_000956100 [Grus japonensis]|uniref:Uncharacterized protein n=1 Tax=Grus japonensis TaxID=30415 RepID=A0ABC9WHE9_GRUJA